MLSWELHATLSGLHPLGGIAPGRNRCNAHWWGARPDQQQALSRTRTSCSSNTLT